MPKEKPLPGWWLFLVGLGVGVFVTTLAFFVFAVADSFQNSP